jgi:Uma2 family endonuclease
MTETDFHYAATVRLREVLEAFFADNPQVYVSGNLFVCYVPRDRRKHVSPDVFVVKGVPKRKRFSYLVWRERKGPDVVIELTSPSTQEEDVEIKFTLYRDVLRVKEYFLFDPLAQYLDPPLQGYRLQRKRYVPIKAVRGRLPSKVLGLHLERHGDELRLYDPVAKQWLPTPQEDAAQAKAENKQLRKELEELRRRSGKRR